MHSLVPRPGDTKIHRLGFGTVAGSGLTSVRNGGIVRNATVWQWGDADNAMNYWANETRSAFRNLGHSAVEPRQRPLTEELTREPSMEGAI